MADASQILDKIIKLPNPQKIAILAVLLALLVAVYYFMIHTPNTEILAERNEELTKLNSQYSEQQKVLANLDTFKQELKDLQIKFEESLKLLPNSSEIPTLLTNISTLAQESGLEIQLFKPESEMAKDFYADIPVSMNVKGKYHDVGYFFDKISKLNRIVNIQNITLKSSGKTKSTEANLLTADFSAVTFKFIEKAQSTQGKKKRKHRKRKR